MTYNEAAQICDTYLLARELYELEGREINRFQPHERAKGKRLIDNYYQYREGAPIAEYHYNCGKLMGKMHELSKAYTPVHLRHDPQRLQ